jgi:hypothetical protein
MEKLFKNKNPNEIGHQEADINHSNIIVDSNMIGGTHRSKN